MIAATIAGMIAAHNRKSPLGSYFQYLSGKLDIIIEQLTVIQTGLALLISKVMEIDKIFADELAKNAIQQLHDEVAGVIVGYEKLRQVRTHYGTDDEFRKDGDLNIKWIDARLVRINEAVEVLMGKGAYGPSTALIMPSAFFVEYSLLTLRNAPRRTLLGAMETNRKWLDRFLDTNYPESTATYIADATKGEAEAHKAAAENPLGARLGMKPSSFATLLCMGYNHYLPPDCVPERSYDPMGNGMGSCSKEVHGAHHRRMRSYALTEQRKMHKLEGNGPAYDAGYDELVYSLSDPSEVMGEGDPRIPDNCDIHTGDFVHSTPGERWLIDRMHDRPEVTQHYPGFVKLIDEINLQRAKISFGTSARAIVVDAAAQLDEIIADLQ